MNNTSDPISEQLTGEFQTCYNINQANHADMAFSNFYNEHELLHWIQLFGHFRISIFIPSFLWIHRNTYSHPRRILHTIQNSTSNEFCKMGSVKFPFMELLSGFRVELVNYFICYISSTCWLSSRSFENFGNWRRRADSLHHGYSWRYSVILIFKHSTFKSIAVLLVAMVLIFETRLLILFGFQHWWRRIRIPWFILDHIVAIVYFIPLYNRIPDQSILKDIIILRVKCVPVYVDMNSMYLFSNVKVVPTTVVSLIMAFYMFQVLIFTFLTAWFLNKQMKRSISENTIKMQKKFLIALVLQVIFCF